MEKHDIQYLRMAEIWAESSYAKKLKVGCLIVKNRTIISDGYNGTPAGFLNTCEDDNFKTFPYVLHAEANAITKLAKIGQSSEGATIYITHRPCIDCAKLIIQAGIKRVVYKAAHKSNEGPDLLWKAGVEVECVDHNTWIEHV